VLVSATLVKPPPPLRPTKRVRTKSTMHDKGIIGTSKHQTPTPVNPQWRCRSDTLHEKRHFHAIVPILRGETPSIYHATAFDAFLLCHSLRITFVKCQYIPIILLRLGFEAHGNSITCSLYYHHSAPFDNLAEPCSLLIPPSTP
jgi:hypothetical protein